MRTPTITLTKPRSFRLPPRAETRARLPAVAAKLREMQTPAVVIVQDPALVARVEELEAVAAHAKQQLHDRASKAWLEAEARIATESASIAALTAELNAVKAQAVERAQRAERMKAYGGRAVDGRAAWEAKMGYKQQQPLVCLTGQRIVTADVWTQPQDEE